MPPRVTTPRQLPTVWPIRSQVYGGDALQVCTRKPAFSQRFPRSIVVAPTTFLVGKVKLGSISVA